MTKPADHCCVFCTTTLPALTRAHSHRDPYRVYTLCWTCQWLFDKAIIKEAEVIEAEREVRAGIRRVNIHSLHRRISRELANGARQELPRLDVRINGARLVRRGLA
jgi:hypothetical protein